MALALYRKYRPQAFAELTGQDHITVVLEREVASGKLAHAYLLSGPRGTGKTSTARILAKAVNCVNRGEIGEPCNVCEACKSITDGKALDIFEIDAASYSGVDNVRETIIETVKYAPTRLRYKFFIIDEAHMLSTPAWNALLKVMEEPPAHVIFVLATTEFNKVPATILSRCQRFDFRRVHIPELSARLKSLAEREGIKVDASVLETIARLAEGCVRDAEGMLDQIIALGEKQVSAEIAALVLPATAWPRVREFLELVHRRKAAAGFQLIDTLTEEGIDFAQFTVDLILMLRGLLLIKIAGTEHAARTLDRETIAHLEQYALAMSETRILSLIGIFMKAAQGLKGTRLPQLPLEIALVEACGEESELGAVDLGVTVALPAPAPPHRPAHKTPAPPPAMERTKNSAAGGGIVLEDIKKKWPEVLKRAQVENHSLPFLLSTSEPAGLTGDILEIGLQYPFHRDKLNEPKSRDILEKILADVYGMPLRIQGTLAPAKKMVSSAISDVLNTLGGRVIE